MTATRKETTLTDTAAVRHRREGVYRCGRCGTSHTHAAFHEDGSTRVTVADRPELAMLHPAIAWAASLPALRPGGACDAP